MAERELTKLTYTHDAMVDLIIQEPTVKHEELAEIFGYSSGWIGRVVNSDAFQARLAERKAQLVDPHLSRALNSRLKTVAIQSLGIISEKLNAEDSAAFALEALGVAVKGFAPSNGSNSSNVSR